MPSTRTLKLFSTCPQSSQVPRAEYLQRVADVARWSDRHGCTGILIYCDNGIVDPWPLAQIIIQETATLSPLVAVQPVYMHPYAVAKMVATLSHLHDRRLYLNMVAGGFRNDLAALDDDTPHDRRYDRLIEYTTIIQRLTCGAAPVTFSGDFYAVTTLRLTPAVPPKLAPGFFVSGSSEAGTAAARALGAVAVRYPKPVGEEVPVDDTGGAEAGVRLGIIAREDAAEAWRVARARFPEDRKGQLAHQLAMKVSDSAWHTQLSGMAATETTEENPYWLHPFRNYQTFCPYLVGAHERVAAEIRRYADLGYRNLILDIPANEAEFDHIGAVLRLVEEMSA